jgi:hypothetical protein
MSNLLFFILTGKIIDQKEVNGNKTKALQTFKTATSALF